MIKYLLIIGIIVLGFCPWLTALKASGLIDARVAELQAQYPDLCAMTIYKESIRKVPFGYTEEVSYDCTKTDNFYGVSQSQNIVFITFYNGLIGMPEKTVTKDINL